MFPVCCMSIWYMAQKSPAHPPSASLRQEGHWLQHSLRGTPWHHLGSATDLRAQGASADGQAAPEDTLGSLYGGADLWVGRQEGDNGLGAGPRHGKWVIMIHPVIRKYMEYVYIYINRARVYIIYGMCIYSVYIYIIYIYTMNNILEYP